MAYQDLSKVKPINQITGEEEVILTNANTPTTNAKWDLKKLLAWLQNELEKAGLKRVEDVLTMAELRTKVGVSGQYKNLLGYYEAGDKPSLLYEWVNGIEEDDGGSVIVVGDGYWKALFGDNIKPEDFGALNNTESTIQFQKCIVVASKTSKRVSLRNESKYILSKRIYIPSNVFIDGNNAIIIQTTDTLTFVGCIYNHERDSYSELSNTDYVYWEYKASTLTESKNTLSKIAGEALKNTRVVTVQDGSGYKEGDYVFISNGYCDMWRVMETPSIDSQKYVKDDVDLWRCEVNQIKSINGNALTLEKQLENDYLIIPKTYGLLPDENNIERYAGYNTSHVERLGGSENVSIKNLNIINENLNAKAIRFDLSVNLFFDNIQITGGQVGYEMFTCYKSKINNSNTSNNQYNISIRRGSSKFDILNCNTTYNSGDASVLVWEGSQYCLVDNLKVMCLNNINNQRTAGGLYFNTSWNNQAVSIFGECLVTVVMIGFCRGGITVSGITSVNSDLAFEINRSFANIVERVMFEGYRSQERDVYTDYLFRITESQKNITNNIIDNTKETSGVGRIHLYKSYGNKVTSLVSKNSILDLSVFDSFLNDLNEADLVISNSELKRFIKRNTYANISTKKTRKTTIENTLIHTNLTLESASKVKVKDSKILGVNSNYGVVLNTSMFLHIEGSYVGGTEKSINFRGNGTEAASNMGAMSFFKDNTFNSVEPFFNYVSLETMLETAHSFLVFIDKQEVLSDLSKGYYLDFRVNEDKTYTQLNGQNI